MPNNNEKFTTLIWTKEAAQAANKWAKEWLDNEQTHDILSRVIFAVALRVLAVEGRAGDFRLHDALSPRDQQIAREIDDALQQVKDGVDALFLGPNGDANSRDDFVVTLGQAIKTGRRVD